MEEKIKQSELALKNLDVAVSMVQLIRQEHIELVNNIKFLQDFIKELTTKDNGKSE